MRRMSLVIASTAVLVPLAVPTPPGAHTPTPWAGLPRKPRARASVTYKCTKRGTCSMICLVHPGMRQRLIAGGKKSGVAGNALVQAQVASQAGKQYASAPKASKTTPPANTVYAGIGDKAT